jgi:hypothetical protein
MKKLGLTGWAAVAEITGTAAVIVSLLFVGFSIKQNTAAVQAMNDNVLYGMTETWYADVVNNPELAELMVRYESGEPLSAADHRRATYNIARSLNQWELAYVRYEQGLFPPKQWESWNNSFAIWITDVFREEDWVATRDEYHKDFAEHVDGVFSKDQSQ